MRVPIVFPSLPPLSKIIPKLKEVFRTGEVTNAKYVRILEESVKEYTGARYAIAVSNATSGLLLTLKALGIKGKVIVPSFTFPATVNAIIWNGLSPLFVDCNRDDFCMNIESVKEALSEEVSAMLPVYIFGAPPKIDELQEIATKYRIFLLFDAAHALGARYKGKMAGVFGDAEVFSLSPTKIVCAIEGGIITTGDGILARRIRIARDYGNRGDYFFEIVGLNARMPEICAIIGIESLKYIEENIKKREKIAYFYKKTLKRLKGIRFQELGEDVRTTFKDFAILFENNKIREKIASILYENGVQTRKYFYPPCHNQPIYSEYSNGKNLINTEWVSERILCLPIYPRLHKEEQRRICALIENGYKE